MQRFTEFQGTKLKVANKKENMRTLFIALLLIIMGGALSAQEKLTDEKRKEFDAQKVAFFTRELDLSPSEAAVFWPLYNEMQKKSWDVEGEMRKGYRELRDAKNLKESDYKEAIGKLLASEMRLQKLKEEYYQRMLLVLPASKIWKLGEAERKFHRQLFDKLRRESCPQK